MINRRWAGWSRARRAAGISHSPNAASSAHGSACRPDWKGMSWIDQHRPTLGADQPAQGELRPGIIGVIRRQCGKHTAGKGDSAARIAVAIGGQAGALNEWRRTLEEAEQTLILGRQLFGTAHVLAFSDLGVYRLLVRLRETPELWTFYRETLAKLVDYDTRQRADLIKTLEAYFGHLGNLRATSESLHVHRNTLLYRLERIKEISGMDLDNSEEYFTLWLALRAHRVLATLDET